jgi:predicted MPP superfamily phosphohydrolase
LPQFPLRLGFPLFWRVAWVVAGLLAGHSASALDLWLPRQHVPAFVQPGRSFSAEVRGAANLPTSGWSASLSNELRSWTCTVPTATYGSIHQGKENGWRLAIAVPAEAPPELFALVVANTAGGTTNRARAVQVVPNFEEDFYILQLTDQHVTNQKAVVAGGNASATYGNGSTDALRWAAPVINLINPRFVLITGDNNQLYNSATSWCEMTEAQRRIQIYFDSLQQYATPTVMVDGNHDVGYSSYTNSLAVRANYESMVGQRVFSFRLGSFYVLGNEFTYDEYLAWAKKDYQAAYADASVQYRLIAQHYPDPWVQVAYATNPCQLMLVGHTHSTGTYQLTPYPIQVSGTSQDYQKASFFAFQRAPNSWTCCQATNHVEGVNVWRLFGDWGSNAAVAATFTRTNNGTQTSNTVAIVNRLPQDFSHGRVKFLMAHGTYVARGGNLEAQYDDAGGSRTAVLVQVNLQKNATTTVTVEGANPASRPQFSKPLLTRSNLVLNGTGGPPGGQYCLQHSTNLAPPVGPWTSVATNLFDPAGNFALTNTIAPAVPQRFFRLRVP